MKEETKVETRRDGTQFVAISWDRDPTKSDEENDKSYKEQDKAAVEALGGVYVERDPTAPYDAMDAAIDRWDEELKKNPFAKPPF